MMELNGTSGRHGTRLGSALPCDDQSAEAATLRVATMHGMKTTLFMVSVKLPNQLDSHRGARCARQLAVAGQQRRVERLCQRDIDRVVGIDVGTKGPRPFQ